MLFSIQIIIASLLIILAIIVNFFNSYETIQMKEIIVTGNQERSLPAQQN